MSDGLKVGFTGTRKGPTDAQKARMRDWLKKNRVIELHHGACVGCDEFAALLGCVRTPKCVCHLPDDDVLISIAAVQCSDVTLPSKPYMERNLDIVDATDILLAMPEGEEAFQGSGTWATIRYARRQRKPVVIFMPDGEVWYENKSRQQSALA